MRVRYSVHLCLLLLLGSSVVVGQDTTSQPDSYSPEPLDSDIYVLRGPDKNVVVSTGTDGTLLVDDQYDGLTEGMLSAIDSIDGLPVRFVVTSGWQTGSPAEDDPLGPDDSLRVVHRNVVQDLTPTELVELSELPNPDASDSPPLVTLRVDDVLEWNGLLIEAWRPFGAESNVHTRIVAPEHSFAHVSNLALGDLFPYVAVEASDPASLVHDLWAVALDADAETVLVPGRGRVLDERELSAYLATLDFVLSEVAFRMQQGAPTEGIAADTPRILGALEDNPQWFADIGAFRSDPMDPGETFRLFAPYAGFSSASPGEGYDPSELSRAAEIVSYAATNAADVSGEAPWSRYRAICETGYTKSYEAFRKAARLPCRDSSLKAIAIGDSWFSYTYSLPTLQWKGGNPFAGIVLDMSDRGAQLITLLSTEEREEAKRKQLMKVMEKTEPQFLLVSYGGNDLIDHLLEVVMRHDGQEASYLDYINETNLTARVRLVEAALSYLFKLVEHHSEDTHILLNAYNRVQPSDQGVPLKVGVLAKLAGYGPWISPVLKKRRIPEEHHGEIADHVIRRLQQGIEDAAESSVNASVVPTDGALDPDDRDDWTDEIHPSAFGFCKLALRFADAMTEKKPDLTVLTVSEPSEEMCEELR